jgi:hypothetical protein
MTDERAPIANIDPVTGQLLDVSFEELAAPLHSSAQELLAYWKTCRARGDFVMGRDVPARAIARLTKNFVVFESSRSPGDFRFRLVGSVLQDRFGRDVSGLLISEVYDSATAHSFQLSLDKVIGTQMPVFQVVRVKGVLGDVRWPETILLPMKSPDKCDDWILCGLFYYR